MAGGRISVVIPALNEGAGIAAAIGSARDGAEEVIVVDGGSSDATRAVAARAGAIVLDAPASRGVQLDAGAQSASGEWLVFLHADTRLERGWPDALGSLPPGVVGGAFRFAVDAPGASYRLLEAGVALRCRLLRLPYGDQSLFARRDAYGMSGGFPPFPLMEDVVFVRRLRRTGPLALLPLRALTSPRRWQRAGIVRAALRNWTLLGLYAAGWPPARLAELYRRAP
jgi:rSAM/selenodomain-associated transferase 2